MENPELLNHIRSLNAACAAEVPDAGCLAWVEDLEHWSSLGVTTPQQFDHFALVAEASDLSKEAFGFKRSWAYLDGLSDSELRGEIAYYHRAIRHE